MNKYIPTSIRPLRVESIEEVVKPMYGIGTKTDTGYGMWSGPFDDLIDCLEVVGKSNDDHILRLTGKTDDILFRWENDGWVPLVLGYCPSCNAVVVSGIRYFAGIFKCKNGHTFHSKDTISLYEDGEVQTDHPDSSKTYHEDVGYF